MTNPDKKFLNVGDNDNDNDNDNVDDTDDHQHEATVLPENDSTPAWPEDEGGLLLFLFRWDVWTFSYMNRVLQRGAQTARERERRQRQGRHEEFSKEEEPRLNPTDLYRVSQSMESHRLEKEFVRLYEEHDGNLFRTLWRLAAPHFVPAGVCQLVAMLAQAAMPLSIQQLLKALEEFPEQRIVRQGLPWVALYMATASLNALVYHRQRHLATKAGIVIRSALMSVAYRRSLQLTAAGKFGLSTGQVTNLVAIDAQKLFEVFQEGHLIWSCPLMMILVTALLFWVMGPATLMGMVVLLSLLPTAQALASRMMALRQARVSLTDRRVQVLYAMLQGIRVTKLNHYEDCYLDKIQSLRNPELRLLGRELFVWSMGLFLIIATPVAAGGATFGTYVLLSDQNQLTASTTFTVILLFSALRFPINHTGRLVGKAAQAYQAMQRMADFLKRQVRTDGGAAATTAATAATLQDKKEKPLMELRNATFVVGRPSWNDLPASLLDSGGNPTLSGNHNLHNHDKDDEDDAGGGAPFFVLSHVNLKLVRGHVMAVVGTVGSGKSTLLSGLVGDVLTGPQTVMEVSSSSPLSMAYASQIPFILNATLLENILFGRPMNRALYERVLDACCLWPDLEQLGSAGDLTEIGERGVTLSGGQKQRVCLARVAYAQPDVALLDDPLSALDAGTAQTVFSRLFQTSNLLRDSAVVLVTHATHFLNRVDSILLLLNGTVAFQGTWDELLHHPQDEDDDDDDDDEHKRVLDSLRFSLQESGRGDKGGEDVSDQAVVVRKPKAQTQNEQGEEEEEEEANVSPLMTVEQRESGLASFRTWIRWFQAAGGISFVSLQIFFMAFDRFAYFAVEWWLAKWTQGANKDVTVFGVTFDAQTNGREAQYDYLKVYAPLLICSFLGTFLRSIWAVRGGARASRRLFERMTICVLGAPMSYFETTPLGRILNRFTFDVEVLDVTLTQSMCMLMFVTSWLVAAVTVMTTILPWIFFVICPITIVYWLTQLHYRKSGADLQRLDAISRSPLQAMLAEGLDGVTTIRVFGQVEAFVDRFQRAVDANSAAILNFVSAQRWLGIRTEFLGILIVLTGTLLVVFFNHHLRLASGIVAILILWCNHFVISLGIGVDHVAEAEAAMTAVERVHAMSKLPQEASRITDEAHCVSESWPTSGRVEFDQVCLRYRQGLPLALHNLSFCVAHGMRCGVVGRTGAGKSSLTVALFRLAEVESGRVLLDGVDLATLGLSDVRGRPKGMAILPQDPVLFAGTVRDCVDPFGSCTDEEVLKALRAVRLAKKGAADDDDEEVLTDPVEEGGRNFSVGERQLLCLARAILAKPQVLVLDEATASVDAETDAFIQQMLRRRFRDTTLLTIAHRLDTIMDYDVVLVMSDGHAAEFGPPSELLENPNGLFTDLVNSTGTESAKALKAIAAETRDKTA